MLLSMKNGVNLLIILFGIFGLSACNSLLYFPNSTRYVNEKKLEFQPTEVVLPYKEHSDHLSWYFESDQKNRKPITIVFTHGNGQNMSAHFRSLYWSVFEGFNFLIVGYPGYGPNEGSPSARATVEVTKEAIRWVQKNRPSDSILIFGQSLGGNIALRAVSEMQDFSPCAVAIEGSFLSYRKIASATLKRSWFTWPFQWLPYLVVGDANSAGKNIQAVPASAAYLVIHGTKDETIPFEMGKELYDSLPEKKTFWAVENGQHIDTFYRHKEYRPQFLNFIQQNCLLKKN